MHKFDSHPKEAQPMKGVPLENIKPAPVRLPPKKILPATDDLLTIFKKRPI